MFRSFRAGAIAFVTALVALSAQAMAGHDHGLEAGDLVLHQPWARASLTSVAKSGAAYLTIENRGEAADRLVGAASPAAKMVEIHKTAHEDGTMKMMPAGPLSLAPGTSTALEPGGLHIMLMGLKEPLEEGGTLEITLRFEKAGAVRVPFDILGGTASGPAHEH